jgi:hypothetical protein
LGLEKIMSEKTLSRYVKNLLGEKVYWDRIECVSQEGVPDVSYFVRPRGPCGVVELKYLKSFSNKMKLGHLTPQQIIWMSTRGPCIKRAFMLLQIAKTWHLIRWSSVWRFQEFTKEDLIKYSYKSWTGTINKEQLLRILSEEG